MHRIVAAIIVGLGMGVAPAAHAQIVINEFLADPVGADTGLEWMELVNVSGAPVDLLGWEIQRATTTWSIRHIFPASLVLNPGEHLVIGELGVAFADETVVALALGNALSTGDAIRICNQYDQIIDVVVYGPNNDDNLFDDSFAIATSIGPSPQEGLTIARIPSGVDTDLSADDWVVVQTATPGAANVPDVADTSDTGPPLADTTDTADSARDTAETASTDTASDTAATNDTSPTVVAPDDTAQAGETAGTADTAYSPRGPTGDSEGNQDTGDGMPPPLECTDGTFASGLVINEFLADPPGVDAGHEWIELFNRSGFDLDLSGWALATGDVTYDDQTTLPAGTFLPDGDYLVIGGAAAAQASLRVPGLTLSDGLTSDAIQLRDCGGTPVDTVIYGPDNAEGWLDDLGVVASSVGPVPQTGRTLARLPDGSDTDDSGVDFAYPDESTPGNSNQLSPLFCGGPSSGVVVNEIYRGSGTTDAWIELLHAGEFDVNLEGWSVQIGRSEWNTAFTFAAGENLLPGGRIVIGNSTVPEAGYTMPLALGEGVRGDVVRLVDCNGFAADTVVYGPENADGWPNDGGQIATSLAPALLDAWSLARSPDGGDTDLSAGDFALTTALTPGRENVLSTEPVTPTDTAADTGLEPASDGCGCGSTGSPVAFWFLAISALRRRR